jgi:hypothetical protein
LALLVLAGASGGVYEWQHKKLETANELTATLIAQTSVLRQGQAALQAEGDISTKNWLSYCNDIYGYCFKYPAGWTVQRTSPTTINGNPTYAQATVTNPQKTLTVEYANPYIHDGAYETFYVNNISKLMDSSLSGASIVGGYYQTSVSYQPMYIITDTTDTNGIKADQWTTNWSNAPRFTGQEATGGTGDISFTVTSNTPLLTTQSANAWFDSIDGRTALQIAQSLTYNK